MNAKTLQAGEMFLLEQKNECEKDFENYPEYLKATNDENRANRQNKMQEYLFLLSINKKKQAEQIRTQYNF